MRCPSTFSTAFAFVAALHAILALAAAPASATLIDVPTAAHPTIQSGLNATSPGDTVRVACGTYHELPINMAAGVVLISETGWPDCVTLEVPPGPTNSDGIRISGMASGEIRGFTLRDASGEATYGDFVGIRSTSSNVDIRDCVITEWDPHGPGIRLESSSPLIENCTITNCGGLFDGGGILGIDSSPTIRNCTIEHCLVVDGHAGGGIALKGTNSALVEDCTIRACFHTGPPVGYGGGILCEGDATIRGCLVEENTADAAAGIQAGGNAAITDCTIRNNGGGGAIYANGPGVTVTDCTLVGNTVGAQADVAAGISVVSGSLVATNVRVTGNLGNYTGAALVSGGGTLVLIGCTLAANAAPNSGGIAGIKNTGGVVTLLNSIVVNECGHKDIRVAGGGTLNLTCTDYDPTRLANDASIVNDLGGNFFADPLFCDPVGCGEASIWGTYELDPSSPCAPANNGCGVLIGALEVGCPPPVGVEVAPEAPASITLYPPAPTPFAQGTRIRFDLATRSQVVLRVYDVAGRLVRTVERGELPAGSHGVRWNGMDDGGRQVPSGVYFCRLDASGTTRTVKVVRLAP